MSEKLNVKQSKKLTEIMKQNFFLAFLVVLGMASVNFKAMGQNPSGPTVLEAGEEYVFHYLKSNQALAYDVAGPRLKVYNEADHASFVYKAEASGEEDFFYLTQTVDETTYYLQGTGSWDVTFSQTATDNCKWKYVNSKIMCKRFSKYLGANNYTSNTTAITADQPLYDNKTAEFSYWIAIKANDANVASPFTYLDLIENKVDGMFPASYGNLILDPYVNKGLTGTGTNVGSRQGYVSPGAIFTGWGPHAAIVGSDEAYSGNSALKVWGKATWNNSGASVNVDFSPALPEGKYLIRAMLKTDTYVGVFGIVDASEVPVQVASNKWEQYETMISFSGTRSTLYLNNHSSHLIGGTLYLDNYEFYRAYASTDSDIPGEGKIAYVTVPADAIYSPAAGVNIASLNFVSTDASTGQAVVTDGMVEYGYSLTKSFVANEPVAVYFPTDVKYIANSNSIALQMNVDYVLQKYDGTSFEYYSGNGDGTIPSGAYMIMFPSDITATVFMGLQATGATPGTAVKLSGNEGYANATVQNACIYNPATRTFVYTAGESTVKPFESYLLGATSDVALVNYATSIQLTEIAEKLITATVLALQKMKFSIGEDLNEKVAAAQGITASSTAVAAQSAIDGLADAITAAQASAAQYASLKAVIDEINTNLASYQSYPGFSVLETALATAEEIYREATTDVKQALADLSAAVNACKLSSEAPVDATWAIVNPDFNNAKNGWTNPMASMNDKGNTYPPFVTNFIESWVNNAGLGNNDMHQVLSNLPNGYYSLYADVNAVRQNNLSLQVSGVSLYAGEHSVACHTGNGFPETYTVNTYLTRGSLQIGLKLASTNANWVATDNFGLRYLGATIEEVIASYTTLANSFLTQGMLGTVRAGIESKRDALGTLTTLNTSDEVLAAINLLQEAMNDAKSSIAEYELLKAAIDKASASLAKGFSGSPALEAGILVAEGKYSGEEISGDGITAAIAELWASERAYLLTEPAPADFTFAIVNPDFELSAVNTSKAIYGWTNTSNAFQLQNNTAFGSKNGVFYCEQYQNSGGLPNSNLSQEITGLPNGHYKVTAAAGFNGAGAFIYANSDEIEFGDNGKYSVIAKVTDGTMTLGIKLFNSTSNYVRFDNFVLEYLCALEIDENVLVVNGKITTGQAEHLNAALTADVASVNFSSTTVSESITLTPANPHTIFYNLPAGVTLANGIDAANCGEVVLDENHCFHAHAGFNAAISYVREFNKDNTSSNSDDVSGWQSIVLPFNATRITAQQNGETVELIPFEIWDQDAKNEGKRPFWLYEVNPSGTNADDAYLASSSLEANTMYLISIPNDESYNDFYNISGAVTFSGSTIAKTEALATQSVAVGTGYFVTPHFGGLKTDADVYALNEEGSAWVMSSSVNSFYGYASVAVGEGSGPRSFSIFGDTTTGIKEILADVLAEKGTVLVTVENGVFIESTTAAKVSVYTLDGQLVKVATLSEGSNFIALPGGQYVINGTKVIVK